MRESIDSLRLEKAALRRALRERIAALDEKELEKSNEKLYNIASALPALRGAPVIFLYRSMGKEPDTLRLIAFLQARGQTVALPVSKPKGEMYFAAAGDTLRQGLYFGILEPGEDAPRIEPAAGTPIIVPALAFDRQGYRIGQGGGYYDRYLSEHSLYAIGLGRACLLQDTLPLEAHDRPVDVLVTDDGVLP